MLFYILQNFACIILCDLNSTLNSENIDYYLWFMDKMITSETGSATYKIIFCECLVCVRYCAKHFISTKYFITHNSCGFHFIDEKTEA